VTAPRSLVALAVVLLAAPAAADDAAEDLPEGDAREYDEAEAPAPSATPEPAPASTAAAIAEVLAEVIHTAEKAGLELRITTSFVTLAEEGVQVRRVVLKAIPAKAANRAA